MQFMNFATALLGANSLCAELLLNSADYDLFKMSHNINHNLLQELGKGDIIVC